MFQGILIFAIAGIVIVAAYIAMLNKRRSYEESLPPKDQLTNEQFRKVEYGDDT